MSDMVEFNEKPQKGKKKKETFSIDKRHLLTNENSHELSDNIASKY